MSILNIFKKAVIAILCIVITNSAAKATTYTAIISGNFNAATTWGGLAPGTLVVGDIVIIPSGITVTLTSTEDMSTGSSLVVNGTLNSSVAGSALILSSGALSGGGIVDVDSLVMGSTMALTFAGTITADAVTSYGSTITAATSLTVINSLRLESGILNMGTGSTLVMSPGSDIIVTGGALTTSGTGMADLHYNYNVWYMTSSSTSGTELSGSGLQDVYVDVPGAVSLGSNVLLNGDLVLTSGNLALNGYTLTFGPTANLSASSMGTITSTASSNIVINAVNSLSGSLRFSTGGASIHDLTVNFGNASSNVNLGTNVVVTGTLALMSGKMSLGPNFLTVSATGAVTGGSNNSYVITDGTGALMMNLVAGASAKFNVGTTTNYTPMIITANTGSASGDVSVNTNAGVYANGTTGTLLSTTKPVVNATWHVSSSAVSGINYNMQAMWSSGMEVNAFDHNQAFISHYSSGAWDVQPGSVATVGGGMYTVSRTGITSLSPFMVADVNTFGATEVPLAALDENQILIYPNPVTNTLHFTSHPLVDRIYIIALDGRLIRSLNGYETAVSVEDLQPGYYSIYFEGTGFKEIQKFVRQ